MEDLVINHLADEIVDIFKHRLNTDLQENMKLFLSTSISNETKGEVLEQLYLLQLYKNAYISPDPDVVSTSLYDFPSILLLKDEEQVKQKLSDLKHFVKSLEAAETHPLKTTKRKLDDLEKYRDHIF